jgi:hypothetical protein
MRKKKRYPTYRTKSLFIPSLVSIYDRDYDAAMKELSGRSASWLRKSFNSYKEDVRLSPSLATKARLSALADSLGLVEKKNADECIHISDKTVEA